MSWSLRIHNGDFVTNGNQAATVIRQAKMLQDLRLWILERMGTDDLHPGFGSLIDGGTRADGTEVAGVIGESDFDFAALQVEQDLRRIITEYQGRQLSRAKVDRAIYGRGTLTPQEVVINVPAINFTQQQDTMKVVITIVTA